MNSNKNELVASWKETSLFRTLQQQQRQLNIILHRIFFRERHCTNAISFLSNYIFIILQNDTHDIHTPFTMTTMKSVIYECKRHYKAM